MQQIKLYISSKLEHVPKLAALRVDGFHINARWIEMADAGRKRQKPVTHWQQENYDDIVAAHFFMLYVEPADHLKGSLEETGYAIGKGKRVWIAGNGTSKDDEHWGVVVKPEGFVGEGLGLRVPHKDVMPWGLDTQRIRMVSSIEQAMAEMRACAQQSRVLAADGGVLPLFQF